LIVSIAATVRYARRTIATGTIPATLGALTNLTHLNLNINRFKGELRCFCCCLRALSSFPPNLRVLQGAVPESLQNAPLLVLDLEHNSLSGATAPAPASRIPDASAPALMHRLGRTRPACDCEPRETYV
jgi:hypothetical protein